MKNITVSDSCFEDMIIGDRLYVDKTDYLFKLLKSNASIYFLSRPRRFGKSLTVSTLKSIFQGKKELFKGLSIYEKYDWEQTYPVLHLDLGYSDKGSPPDLKFHLAQILRNQCLRHHIDVNIEPNTLGASFEGIILTLAQKAKSGKVAIFIDEYNKPILNQIGKSDVQEIIDILSSFYSTLKGCSDLLRFVFITGVSNFSSASLFSGLNNLEDISIDPEYATMLGYTQKELEENFVEYIEESCVTQGMDRTQLLDKIAEWYDGYRFCEDTECVYNPIDIAYFFSNGEHEFNRYWYTTGTPTFLTEYAKKKNIHIMAKIEDAVPASLFDPVEIYNADVRAIMFQTGYLTIRDSFTDENGNTCYHLKFPNHEVEYSFKNYLLSEYLNLSEPEAETERNDMVTALRNRDLHTYMLHLKKNLAGCGHRILINREARLDFFTCLGNAMAGVKVTTEETANNGTIDMVVRTQDTVYIFEFKLNQTAKVALDQIEDKRYYEKFTFSKWEIFIVGINYSSKQRQIDDWKAKRLSKRGDCIEEILPPPVDGHLKGSSNK